MPGIYIYSEDSAIIGELITAGLKLKEAMNQPVTVITLSNNDAESFIKKGADKAVVLKGKNSQPESYFKAVAGILKEGKAEVLLVGATFRGKDLAAKAAAITGAGLVTDAQSVEYKDGAIQTTRLVYGGLAVCTETIDLPAFITLPPRLFAEAIGEGSGDGEISVLEVDNEETQACVDNVCPIVRQGADIANAQRVVCVGRGLSKKEDLSLALELGKAIGGEIGCTRGISEDYHWLPGECYIGISGQKVKPELYLGFGISGQIQHVVGIRDSKIIVAIDSNEKAPIFEAADYGIVGDLYEVVPLLTQALKNK